MFGEGGCLVARIALRIRIFHSFNISFMLPGDMLVIFLTYFELAITGNVQYPRTKFFIKRVFLPRSAKRDRSDYPSDPGIIVLIPATIKVNKRD